MKTLVFFLFFLSFSSFADEITLFSNGKLKITYDEDKHTYQLNDKKESFEFPRHSYTQLLEQAKPYLAGTDFKRLEELITTHSLSKRLTEPTVEEELQQALKTQSLAMSLVNLERGPCPTSDLYLKGPSQYQIDFKQDPKKETIDRQIIKTELAKDGFLSMGELLGVGYELNSSNDNFLHGGGIALGITDYNKGIDGDDRGKTFGLLNKVNFEFEKGSLSLTSTTQGYGRVKPQKKTNYSFNGTPIEQTLYYDENGKYFQEFLVIDGLELEVKRELGNSDFYVKVIGKREVFDDDSGLAKKIQEKWHALDKRNVQYHYLDYKQKTIRYSGFTELGREFTIKETDKYKISSDLAAGVQVSNEREGQYISMRGDLKATWNGVTDSGKKYASWEGRVYWDGKQYRDKERDSNYGVEITKRWSVTKNGFIYLQAAVAKEDERYARDYGASEIDKGGHLDLQHKLGIGFEYKF